MDAEERSNAVGVVRRAFEVDGIGELRDVAAFLWHEDIVYMEDPLWPGADTFDGRQAVLARFEAYVEDVGLRAVELIEVEGKGEHVLCVVRLELTGVASGVPLQHVWGYAAQVRDGRVARMRAFLDPEQARRAVREAAS